MKDNNVGEFVPPGGAEPHEKMPTILQVRTTEEPAETDGSDQDSEFFVEVTPNVVVQEDYVLSPGGEDAERAEDEGSDESDDDEAAEDSEINCCVELDDQDQTAETNLDEELVNGSEDNEVERHDVIATLSKTELHPGAMVEASKTALYLRYSRMTPSMVEEQERSFHEEVFYENATRGRASLCPEPTVQACQNPVCIDQLRWRDARIAELQAALDHMTEAMAIQQRDMASQRVFLSRQAEQLTNLSNKLHQDKVALHLDRERFQKIVASTPPIFTMSSKLKPAAGKIKSPMKKLFSAATGRRATLTGVEHGSSATMKLHSSSASPLEGASRTSSSSQLRRNPLVSDSSLIPDTIKDRSSSLSVLDIRQSFEQSVVAVTPTKDDVAHMVDVKLTDGFSPAKYTTTTTTTPTAPATQVVLPDLDSSKRTNRLDSLADPSSVQKKQSLGDRLRSMRWTRS
jgi:hypothetical protein